MANSVTSFEVQNNAYSINPDLNFDSTPTIGSTNPVTSNGIALAVQSASIGDNISFGRVDGSDIGYASISYGEGNIATNTSGIVFGTRNICSADYTIISGFENYAHGSRSAIFGNSNAQNGEYCLMAGSSNILNARIQTITENSYPDTRGSRVYIGYVNPSTKKIYSDAEMTQEIAINRELSAYTHYFVDLREHGTQHAGDVYLYKRASNTITLTKFSEYYNANFTNICYNTTYEYHGPCYYNGQNDKIYSDGAFTNEIPLTGFKYNKTLFFDLMDHTLLLYNYTGLLPYGSAPTWVKVTTYVGTAYKGGGSSKLGLSKYYGRQAYINDEYYTGSEKFHVYTSPERTPESDITDLLFDGEVIANISNITTTFDHQRLYKYTFDTSHRLVKVEKIGISNSCSIIGVNNYFGSKSGTSYDHSYTSIIGGNNEIISPSRASMVIGELNTVSVATGGFIVAGHNNDVNITGGSASNISTTVVLGIENEIHSTDDNTPFLTIIGDHNFSNGTFTRCSNILGNANGVVNSAYSSIIGSENSVNFASNIRVVGSNNSVNKYVTTGSAFDDLKEVVSAILNKDGTITIGTTTYDVLINPSSLVSLPTNQIFCVYGRQGYTYSRFYEEDDNIIGYAYSSTGRELIWLDDNNMSGVVDMYQNVNIFGAYNQYIRSFHSFTTRESDSYNYIIGAYNELRAAKTEGVGLIGYHLICHGGNGNPNCAPKGYMVLGAYNSHNSSDYLSVGCKTQLVVGIGTADNDRKNGFVVTSAGVLLAPECPDTIGAATGAVNPVMNKALVTYGMLKDYAPGTPGAVGRPTLLVQTLEQAEWSNNEYEVAITGMTSDAVVILQASGDPTGFYNNKLYLKSQTTDKIVIGCGLTPGADTVVRVVYWL